MSFGGGGRIAYDQSGTLLFGGSSFGHIGDMWSIYSIERDDNYTTITTTTSHTVSTAGQYIVVSGVGDGFDGDFIVFTRTQTTITYYDPGSNASKVFGIGDSVSGNVRIDEYKPAYFKEITNASADYATSVAIGNGRIVVGSPSESKVYIYDLDGTLKVTLSGTAGYGFGYSVAVGNGMVAVGAPYYSTNRGRCYLYRIDGTAVTNVIGATSNHYFGTSVSIGGDRLLVGAPGGTVASVYNLSGSKQFDLTGTTGQTGSFGGSVVSRRNRFFVSSSNHYHIFSQSGDRVADYTYVGTSLDVSGITKLATDGYNVVLGNSTFSTNSGRAKLAKLGHQTMQREVYSYIIAGEDSEKYGYDVAVGSNTVVVGRPVVNQVHMYFGGVLYNNAVADSYKILEPHTSATNFGKSVAINGSRMVVGANGKIYIYKVVPSYNMHEAASYYDGDL